MRNFTKSWLLKSIMFSLAILMGLYSTSWAQGGGEKDQRDPSTITVVPMSQEGGNRAVGDDCTNPIIIAVPAALPYNNTNYTCGRGNTYSLPSTGCMSYYTSGEDLIYRLDVTANTLVTLTMNPGPTTYGGIGIFLGCPNTGTCLGAAYGYAATPKVINEVALTAGNQYYVMIDTWAAPTCIPSLTLNIIAVTPPPPPPPGTIEIGNGTTYGTYPAYYGPWGNYWENCKTQTLYLASELGAPTGKLFTEFGWKFGILPTGTNYLNNVTISIKETTATSLTAGAYADMTGATQVFYAASFVPATALGWRMIDITDYVWNGTNNIIIEVVWGDNGYYVSPYYETYKTDAVSANRMIIGYADAVTPPNYSGISTYYDNLRIYASPLNPPGNIEGYVFNYDGLTISGATVAVQGGPSTTSGADGHYLLANVNSGDKTVGCGKAGYNPVSVILNVPSGGTIIHDFVLTQPNMIINPLLIEETLNPGEYFTTSLNVLNNGSGPLGWEAVINYPETDNVPAGTVIEEPAIQYEPNGNPSIGYGQALGEDGNRDLMLCPDGSLFSIPPVGSNNGYTSTLGTGYKCSQSFSGVTGAISTVTFWAIYTGPPPPTPTFKVDLCLPGGTPGAIVTTITTPIPAVNTGVMVIGYPTYIFTVEVPSTALAAGWVTVEQQTSSPTFYWLNTTAGAGFPAQQNGSTLPERLAVCLGGGGGGAGNWLTMDYYEGTVLPFGGVANIPTHLNAAGTSPGEVYTAEIVFTSNPNVSTITVPVTMIILGTELVAPENLEVTLINDVTGQVGLTWEWNGDSFQFFMIKRNGVIIGTTTATNFIDILPDYGEFCYTVQAVYDEGSTSPAGPECIEWPNPVLYVNPNDLHGWVWVGFTVDV